MGIFKKSALKHNQTESLKLSYVVFRYSIQSGIFEANIAGPVNQNGFEAEPIVVKPSLEIEQNGLKGIGEFCLREVCFGRSLNLGLDLFGEGREFLLIDETCAESVCFQNEMVGGFFESVRRGFGVPIQLTGSIMVEQDIVGVKLHEGKSLMLEGRLHLQMNINYIVSIICLFILPQFYWKLQKYTLTKNNALWQVSDESRIPNFKQFCNPVYSKILYIQNSDGRRIRSGFADCLSILNKLAVAIAQWGSKNIYLQNLILFLSIASSRFDLILEPMEQLKQESFSTKIEIAGLVFFLACYAVLSAFLQYRHYPIHRGAVAVLIGVLTGLIIRLSSPSTYNSITKMDETIIFLLLLPAILFSKGYTFKKGAFVKNIRFIALFGIVGTFLLYIVITLLVYAANQLNLMRDAKDITNFRNLSLWEVLLLSACLCSIDTVASEEAVEEIKYRKLNSIIVGEDIFKDCVTIVLFRSILRLENMQTPTQFVFYWYTPFQVLLNFLYLILGSFILGCAAALATTYMFKRMRFLQNDNGVSQTTTLFLLGFTTYVLSECFSLSGIISILCYGVVLNRFNYFNLSPNGQTTSKNTFLFVANISEGLMFLIMGIMVWQVEWEEQSPDNPITHSYVFCAIVILILIVGRVVNILLLWFAAKSISPSFKLNKNELFIIFVSGLARGATPFALFTSVEFLDSGSKYAKNQGLVLKTTIIIVVLLCTVVLNSFIPRIFKKPLHNLKAEAKQYLLDKSHESVEEHRLKKMAKSSYRKFEEQKIRPALIYDYEGRKKQIEEITQNMKAQLLKLALQEFEEQEQSLSKMHQNSMISTD